MLRSASQNVTPSSLDIGQPLVRCVSCDRNASGGETDFRCAGCGDILEIRYSLLERGARLPQSDIDALRSAWTRRKTSNAPEDQSGVWRFRELLPILADARICVTHREGNTPLYPLPRISRALGLPKLLAKHQGMNPTGSFKDTGMTASISVAREKNFSWVACASTGNTSASMAAYASRAGMNSFALIPDGQIAWSKVAQALDYGAHLLQLKADFDGCVRVLAEVVRKFPVYLVNSVNPYRREGQKTAAFELMEQLEWHVPDHVIVPGGNLANSSAIGKGFAEMRELGLIEKLPRISIIQAEGANPLARSMSKNGGRSLEPVHAETRATAIRIGNPALWKKAVDALNETAGRCEDVSEDEIAIAKAEIGAEGIGCEPASATTLAGLKKLLRSNLMQPDESVVLILTGHTLKDPEYALEFHRDGHFAAQSAEAARLRRPPLAMDADSGAVIRELEKLAH
ncbi:MAG TPA: threonine synthase [Candidatus Acidoferrales bacterium]|nr:threonine synthase [Candidatus Acidoferrales bacterium]